METVSVQTVSETGGLNDCQTIPELSDKQKKRSGKKKRKSRKQDHELKNNDSHITSQNGNADEAFSSGKMKQGETDKSTNEDQVQLSENCLSTLPAESCQRDSILCVELGATLHHTEPSFSTREDSLPDANKNGSIKKKKKRRGKKKKDGASCDAEKTTKEDQVHPPDNPLSNDTTREESRQLTQDSCEKHGAAQLCTGPNLLMQEDSQPDATKMTSSRRRKKKRERDTNTFEESGVDFHSTTAEVAAKYNTVSEAEGSKSISKEENSVASVVIDSCGKSKDDTVEQRECTDVKLNETVVQTQIPKAKKRKKRKTKLVEVCDPLGYSLATAIKSGHVECVENNDGNGGRELMSQRENSATGEEVGFHNREKTKEKETDENTEVKEDDLEVKHTILREAEGSKTINIEEKSVSSVVINNCLKFKDDTMEQRECTDVKLNETLAQTQNPKAKKRKKRKITTVEVCGPLGNTLPTSTESGPVECVENNDGNAGRELMSYSASPREKSATGEESGLQTLEKTKEKETDENTEVKEDVLGAGACDVRSKKRKGKKKKTSSADHKTADMEVCDPTGSVECLLDHSNKEDMQNCEVNAGQFGRDDPTNKTEKSATIEKSGVQKSGKRKEMTRDKNIESIQYALGAEGVSDVGRKRHKRKSNKNTNSESVAIMDSEPVQCLLYHANREGVEKCDGNADGELASKDLASKLEDSATKGEIVEDVENSNKNKKDEKDEVDQDALGAEAVSKDEVKTKKSKKKKNSLDHKTDNMEDEMKIDKKREVEQNASGAEGLSNVEVKTKKRKKKKNSLDHNIDNIEEKGDVSLPRNDEESEFDKEKLETSLSNSVLLQNNVAKGVASSESEDVPRCSCEGQRTRKLLIFDLNGILADIVQGYTGQFIPDGKVSYRSVFRRPFVSSFLDFCFERFEVAIWSSRRIGLDYMINIVMENYSRNLLFCFDQNNCTTTKFKTQEKNDKPLFLKDLRRVWERFGTCISCGKRKYDETNTLLVDDSPNKALCNPPHSGIFPCPYQYKDCKDSALGPEGELRKYLERLVDADNVQKFVAENPYGQSAITETHKSWEFYSEVFEAHK